jgi:hydrogenase expression/formation protein HypC
MCLAVPGRVLDSAGDDLLTRTGRVDFGGVIKEISLAYTPEAVVGDHVLVHVGFAIAVLWASHEIP